MLKKIKNMSRLGGLAASAKLYAGGKLSFPHCLF
jgi:hypothetical protein